MKRYIIPLIVLLNLLFSATQATEWKIQHHINGHFRAVWGSAANDVFAVGRGGLIFHYDGSQWQEMETETGTVAWLYGIWGSSSTDVFAVGDEGTILHYDGNQWSAMNSGIASALKSVWGNSGTDVFAVGSGGTILHYNGTQWSTMTSGTSYQLNGIWGSTSTDVLVVGSKGTILHYDGNQWSTMISGTSRTVYSIWGSASTNIFAVGTAGQILHYDGNQWSTMTSDSSSPPLTSIWGNSSTDVFAVERNGSILHYDGNQWGTVKKSGSKLWGIWGSSNTDVFVVGGSGGTISSLSEIIKGTILHYDGNQWNTTTIGNPYWSYNLHSLWGNSSNDVFTIVAANNFLHYDGNQWGSFINDDNNSRFNEFWGSSSTDIFAVGRNIIRHYNGTQWNNMNFGISPNITIELTGIWGSSSTDVFAVGANTDISGTTVISSVIYHYDGNTWSSMNTGTAITLMDIWGSSSTDVFAVGENGTILHYDGNQWNTMNSGTATLLLGIWGYSSTNVFAVGWDGTILHYDGSTWTTMNSGTSARLTGIWGSHNQDVFAVGRTDDETGIILHYDGDNWIEITNTPFPLKAIWGSPEGDIFAEGNELILRCTDCQQQISELQATPRSHNFWNITVGEQASQTFTVTNTGNGDAQLQPLVLANPTDFALNNDTCSNTLLTPANTCQVTVNFQPQSEGSKLTKLTLPSSTTATDILLAGTGCSTTFQQVFNLYPESPNFGTILVGDTISLNQTVNFTAIQTCGEELQIEAIEVVGQDAAEFSVQNLDCTYSHWDKYSYSYCRFNTVFTPTVAGEKQAELTFKLRDHSELPIPTVALQAKAVTAGQAQLELTPTEYDFGSVTLGRGSNELQTFILNNSGELSLKLDNFTLTGDNATEFSLDKWQCTALDILHPGEQCDLNVWFMPTTLGQKQARLTVTSDLPPLESLLLGIADGPKDCNNTNITIESSQTGHWNAPTTWSTSQIPNETDVVRINSGHIVTSQAFAKVRTLCVSGTLQSLDNQGTALEIQATDYLENQGLIRGQPGADELAGSTCTQAATVGTTGCAQPGASVILKVGTEFHQQDKLGDWWWYGLGGPILNTGEIIAGKGGDGLQYGAPGGNALVLGRNTTNTNRIQAGEGGNVLGTQPGESGRGGLTQIWGKLGGPGHLYNQNGAQALAGNGGHCNPQGTQQTGGNGGNLWLVSLPDVHIEGGITQAGRGGDQCTVGGKAGFVQIEPNVISLAGAQTQVNGGDIAIYGGNDWTLDLSNLNGTVIEASGNITLAVGTGGLIDLRNSTGPILKAQGEVQIFADNILLEFGETLAQHIEADSIVVGPSKILRDVALVAPSKVSGKLGDTVPVQLTLTNGGPAEDVYTITVMDSTQNWQQLAVVPVNGLETVKVLVNLTIPNANFMTLKATSQADTNVFSTTEVFVIQIPVVVNNPNSNQPKVVVTPVTTTPTPSNIIIYKPENKSGQPQSEPLQPQSKPEEPQSEPLQPQSEPEEPQSKPEEPQSKPEKPQSESGKSQPEVIQDQQLTNHSELSSIEIESAINPNYFVVETLGSNTCPTLPGVMIDWLCRNQGQVLTDVTLENNAKVAGGQLAGVIDNQGFVSQVTIQPDAVLKGGKLSGYIVNQGTLMDFEFVGAQVWGGTLAGNIVNNSLVGGIFVDVHLAAGTHLSGGSLQGEIHGDSVAPALLEDLTIQAGSHLANVIIGKNVKWSEDVEFEDNVQFIEQSEIPCENHLLVEMLPVLPPVNTLTLGHSSGSCTQFAGGISTDGEIFQRQLTVNLVDAVEVRGRIAAAPNQLVNETVDWVLYATYWATEETSPLYFMVDNQGQVLPWDGDAEQLVAFEEAVVLKPLQEIIWYRGQFPATGRLEIQFGYRLADGTLIVNQLPLEVVIQE
jgi:hypothetical protein